MGPDPAGSARSRVESLNRGRDPRDCKREHRRLSGRYACLRQCKAILETATGPIRKIIVTHAHGDHSGGLPSWKKEIARGADAVGRLLEGAKAGLSNYSEIGLIEADLRETRGLLGK